MANEQETGAPLTASVGEQLAEKAHLDEVRAEERRPDEVVERRVERRKAVEREDALRHAGVGAGAGRRGRGRGGGERRAAWQVVAAGVAALGALVLLRRALR